MMSYSMLVDLSNSLLEENKHLKATLKKKDAELKAARYYYNECLKDLKKAHVEIEILKKNPPRFILTDDGSLEEKIKELNPLVMSSDNASIVCIDADKIRAEAIKECLDKVAVFCAESGLFHCEADEMLLFNYLDSLKMQAMLEANGMVGDTE